ncbi:hypothetical protein D9V37_01140 [Nocardioides mangrovicus]|uniref:Uncharacterized protein n=1 Tax=Nocardioides mangrovicus TaxID=2478913 RepID=A0A3L8P694_9ACTN|nr:hypothetical protein [Nocardioides mangrovicus]RLV50604.1 hypothetical protein D9V37_01140 [Nocardioides mangrovicus]
MSDEDAHESEQEPEPESDGDSGSPEAVGTMPEVSEGEQEQIESEREERLDPDNRPDEVEVDNTERDFDSEAGMFTDNEDYEESEKKFDDSEF